MTTFSLPAIVSVHDVMPETLEQVTSILTGPLRSFDPVHVLLLVVPGRDWQPAHIEQLRVWRREGYELAGHGWSHEVVAIRSLYHRLHSTLLSRRAAEHLSQEASALQCLMLRNAQWFGERGFGVPTLYVPPAWALGKLSLRQLQGLPFGAIETLGGFREVVSGRFRALPLAGYEADTLWRARVLSGFNYFAYAFARWHANRVASNNILSVNLGKKWRATGQGSASVRRSCENPLKPLRLAIHPMDFEYHLSAELRAVLQDLSTVHWSSVF